MKIGVLGDSHGQLDNIDLAMNYLKGVDLLIHTGDTYVDGQYIVKNYGIKLLGVKGNYDEQGPGEIIVTLEGKKIFLCHGHQYGVKYGYSTLFYRGKEVEGDIVIFGHTHVPLCHREENMLLLNPGSVSLPRGGSKKSCALISIEKDQVQATLIQL